MSRELASLQNSIAELDAVLARSDDVDLMRSLDEVTQSAVRSGAIQRFGLAYDSCWKFIKNRLSGSAATEGLIHLEWLAVSASAWIVVTGILMTAVYWFTGPR